MLNSYWCTNPMNKLENEFSKYLSKIKASNILIIVEGKKDRLALEHFGITNIIELSKKPLFKVIEDISLKNKKCIILTDLDKKGKELYGKLNHGLQQNGIIIDNSFRNFLYKNTDLRQIEGLVSYMETISKTKD